MSKRPEPLVAATSGLLAAAAGVHVLWGLRVPLPGVDRAAMADAVAGTQEVPSPAACFAVAGALGTAGCWWAGSPGGCRASAAPARRAWPRCWPDGRRSASPAGPTSSRRARRRSVPALGPPPLHPAVRLPGGGSGPGRAAVLIPERSAQVSSRLSAPSRRRTGRGPPHVPSHTHRRPHAEPGGRRRRLRDDDDEPAGESGTTQPEASCPSELPLKESGTLTVATGEPAFEPWMVDDDPTNGEGFESALVYALAEQMGIDEADVKWTRTGFDEAIAPGDKDYDFNIQQFSITAERDEVVDFSDGYYTVEQAIVGRADSADRRRRPRIEDLKELRLGAAIGTTSLDYIEEVIQPDDRGRRSTTTTPPPRPPSTPTRSTASCSTCPPRTTSPPSRSRASIVGVLPSQGDAEELGMLFETAARSSRASTRPSPR